MTVKSFILILKNKVQCSIEKETFPHFSTPMWPPEKMTLLPTALQRLLPKEVYARIPTG